jgi:hypothetical protein
MCIWVEVVDQLTGVFLLQLDEALVVERCAFRTLVEGVGVLNAIRGFKGAADEKIKVDVDAALLQFGNELVFAVEGFRIEGAGVGTMAVDEAARRFEIEELEANAVDAEAGQGLGPESSLIFGRNLLRARAPVGNVDAPQPDAPAVSRGEVPVADFDKTVFACGRVKEERDIDGRRRECATADDPWRRAPCRRWIVRKERDWLRRGGERRRPERSSWADSSFMDSRARTMLVRSGTQFRDRSTDRYPPKVGYESRSGCGLLP